MKKLNFFKKLGLCALSAALCASAFAFSACDNDKSDDEEQKQEQTSGGENQGNQDNQGNQGNQGGQGGQTSDVISVTEAEWKIATGLDFDYSYTQTSTLGDQSFSLEIVYSNGVLKYDNGESSSYWLKDGEKYYYYRYNSTAQKWEKQDSSQEELNENKNALIMFTEQFSAFTFDGKDSYTCAELVYSPAPNYSVTMKNVKITFNADKKVAATYFEMTMNGEAYTVSSVYDYSAKTITLPKIEEAQQPVAPNLTEAEWNAAMKLDFDYSLVQEATSVFNKQTIKIENEMTVSDGIIKQTSKMSGQTRASEVYYQKNDNDYYRYSKDSNGDWSASAVTKEDYDSMNEGLINFAGRFSEFTFDGTTYSCESLTTTIQSGDDYETILIKNIKIKFNADKKVESVECVMYTDEKVSDNFSEISMKFDYSAKEITLPQVKD